MQILNIAGYKFIPLDNLAELRAELLTACHAQNLKGTILLSAEGINISLAGEPDSIHSFMVQMENTAFNGIHFHQTYSDFLPFRRLKVKLKKEIITMRQPGVDVTRARAPSISPTEFKQWLDAKKDITILDTRNDYEVQFGTFTNAVNLKLKDFSELPDHIHKLDKDKPVVMFCTGGIRCEKAAIYMQQHEFEEVYQLDSGILGYFAEVGGEHYQGECFVFDGRTAVNPELKVTGTQQCVHCQGPIFNNTACHCRTH